MSHLDEGTLHALLDGELDAHEVREIQAHLGSCTACGARLQSAKEMFAESDRLVGAIQFPGTPRRPAALDPDPEADTAARPGFAGDEPYAPAEPAYEAPQAFEPAAAPRPPERRFGAEPVYDEPPPVLLIPEDNQWSERRRRMLTTARWAALVLVAVGAGYIASEVRRTGGVPALAPAAPLLPAASDESVGPVVSPEETARPDAPAALPRAVPEASAATDRVAESSVQKSAPPAARTEPPPARAAAPAAVQEDRAGEREVAPASEGQARDEDTGREDMVAADVREEAAQAMAELDRQRRRERAAAATAALRRQPAAPEPVPVPAPRTLEQRAGTYLRIGLDEAARQLGRPVHVIEGMQPQFMGLAQGAASAGADPSRPVVRVVYQDNQGRMILLDQQRIRPGQTWGEGETRWVVGEIGLSLQGEPGPAILRNLRPRVR